MKEIELELELDEPSNQNHFKMQFSNELHSILNSKPFYFFQHYDHPSSTTWQVMRSEFDNLIMEKARNNGTEIRELTKAKSLIKEDGNVVGINVENEVEYSFPSNSDLSLLHKPQPFRPDIGFIFSL